MDRKMRPERNKQIIFSSIMIALLTLTICAMLVNEKGNISITVLWDVATILLFVISLIDKPIFRHFQSLLFFLMSLFAFYQNSIDSFWSWGLYFISLLISQYYGFWQNRVKLKAIITLLLTLLVFALSALRSGYFFINFSAGIIYLTFFIVFIIILYKEKIDEVLKLKNDYKILLKSINEKRNTLEDYSVDEKQDESNLKMLSESLDMDIKKLREKIKSIPALSDFSDVDISIILSFYISSGNKTNKELAFDIDKTETFIKNRFRNIYKKIDGVACRSALLSFISKELAK